TVHHWAVRAKELPPCSGRGLALTQAGHELLSSNDQSTSASQSVGMTGVSHRARPAVFFFKAPLRTRRWEPSAHMGKPHWAAQGGQSLPVSGHAS
uniref:Uncharacterized protein n=1 Tax=Prolemur simus TaxID=1328070 RepID=A0A8C8Z810_PROSS